MVASIGLNTGSASFNGGISSRAAEIREKHKDFYKSVTPELQNDVMSKSNEKVSFKEGLKLVGAGFITKAANMFHSIIKNPGKTLLAVGGTALMITAAPIIGLTSATAAAALALGFATFAVGKTAKDTVKTVKDNHAGKYDEVRKDLKKLGGDGLDLALSLPFVPKAAKQISRFAKYGRSAVGLNTELLSNLKSCKSLSDVRMAFAKSDMLINYDMIGKEMGLAVKPQIEFIDLPASPTGVVGGAYEPTTGKLQINKNILSGKGKLLAKMAKMDPEVVIRHELEHFKQFADIAKTEGIGIDALGNTITEYYKELTKQIPASEYGKCGLSKDVIENMLSGDKSAFNRKFYQDVVNKSGAIKAGTPEADMAAKYLNGLMEKVKPNAEQVAAYEKAVKGINVNFPSYAERVKIAKAQMNLYKSNILEKDAFAAQDKFIAEVLRRRPTMIKDMLMADAAINKGTAA